MESLKDILDNPNFASPEVVAKVTEVMKNPPEKISINVEMTGMLALKHQFCRQVLMAGCGLSETEADKYLIRSGAEREISRLVSVWNYFHDNQDQFEIYETKPEDSN